MTAPNRLTAVSFAVLLLVSMTAAAAPASPSLHGILLGMTPSQASAAAQLPCKTPQYTSNLSCKDASDGSEYLTMFSAGEPSIALTVQHGFCSRESSEAALDQALQILHLPVSRAHHDPDGYYIDLDGNDEAVLNADAGTCPSGGKHYVLLIRSDDLIKLSARKAAQRARKARY